MPGKGLGLSPAWCAVTRSWPHRSFVWEPGPAALPGNQPEAVGTQEKVPQNPVQAAAGPSEVRALGRKPALWWLCGPPGDFCCGRVRGCSRSARGVVGPGLIVPLFPEVFK